MAKSPPSPEFDVALVTMPNGTMTAVWWEWLQRYVKWDEACCEAGGGGGSSGVSEIAGTPPVVVTGTALFAGPEALSSGAVTISMPPATGSVNGYLKATDWTTFNGKAAGSHTHPESDVVNLVTDLAGKAALVHTHAESDVTGLVADLALKAPLDSPALTGNPTAPTPSLGDADTSIATTAFVSAAVSNTFAGGMSTAEYTYSTTTTTPPSTGQLRANTTTQNAITAFYLHETNAVGIDITNALKLIATGVKILCQDKTNAANVQYYVVTGPAVDNGVYFTIPVTWTTGGSNFTPGRVIFAGFGIGSNNMLEAPTDGSTYGRRGSDASWQTALPLTGGALSGDLTVSKVSPAIVIDKTTDADGVLYGHKNGVARWGLDMVEGTAETGSNTGSNFRLIRYSDAGTYVADAIAVNRATGMVTATGVPRAPVTPVGVGQVVAINTATAAGYTLPGGGTWFVFGHLYNATTGAINGGAVVNVAAGGTAVFTGTAGSVWLGFAWRIA